MAISPFPFALRLARSSSLLSYRSLCRSSSTRRTSVRLTKRWSHSSTSVQTLIFPERRTVNAHFLRDSCRCSLCVDASTQAKHVHVSEFPSNLTGVPNIMENGDLEVLWYNGLAAKGQEEHTSRYSPRYLQQLLGSGKNTNKDLDVWKSTLWNRATLKEIRSQLFHDYATYMQSDVGLNSVVQNILQYGLAFITNVPSEVSSVKTLAERIGPLRNSFYGETWDVRSVVDPKNVAYTSQFLGFHQDLLYMAHPPDLQLLHVLRASTGGGESMFADGAYAVRQLQNQPNWPRLLKGLQVPVTYRYSNDNQWYQQFRPGLEKNGGAAQMPADDILQYPTHFDTVNWSPPFQGPFSLASAEEMDCYYEASVALKEQLELESNIFELRMEPGTCVVFNNRRIMHARRAFDTSQGGERWLRGAYVDWDPLMSRWREARRRRGDITPGDDVRLL